MGKFITVALAILILVLAGVYILSATSPLPASILPQYRPDVKNGETLFYIAGCGSCHAAPKGDKCDDPRAADKRVLSGGRCLKTKFGTFSVPNISPHPTHGIGAWSKIEFVNAMLRGISPRNRHYYPAFPYTSYHIMAVEDVLDLKAYLDSLPNSKSVNKPHNLKAPFSVRQFVGLWKIKNFARQKPNYRPDIGSSQLDRGRYLVNGPGHCGECHTPRDGFGTRLAEHEFSGAPAASGKGWVPNITPHKSGLKSWTENQIADFLATGLKPDFDIVGGDMVAVQDNIAKVSAADRAAIALYLKSLKPIKGLKRPKKKTEKTNAR